MTQNSAAGLRQRGRRRGSRKSERQAGRGPTAQRWGGYRERAERETAETAAGPKGHGDRIVGRSREGVHTYSYVANATTPGRFVVPPTKAEEMVHPETFGRSASDVVWVR